MNALAMPSLIVRSLAALSLAATACFLPACSPTSDLPEEEPPLAGARIGGPFTLTGSDGGQVTWSDFDGKYRIVYFGYTFCPDVCPFDMQRLAQAHEAYTKAHPEVEIVPIFISVDPARDTPEVVGEFTAAFSPAIVGLTGSVDEIDAVAKSFAAYASRGEPDEYGAYTVTHGPPGAYLFGPQGEPLALLPVDESAEATVAELERWIR